MQEPFFLVHVYFPIFFEMDITARTKQGEEDDAPSFAAMLCYCFNVCLPERGATVWHF